MALFKKKHVHADVELTTQMGQDVEVGTAEDVDALMRQFDRESNTRIWEGKWDIVIKVVTALFSLYCIWSTLVSTAALEVRLTAFVGFIIVLGYLNYPANKHHVRPNFIPWYDIVIMILGAAAFFYYCVNYDAIAKVITSASKVTSLYIVVGVIGIASLIELCRRCVGLPILCVAGALIVYTFASGNGLNRVIFSLFYDTSGILSTPINVCAKYIVVFIIFGAFLERTGIASFFISLANALVGWASGGPAKVAVISSALCGMVSGSSVGNTVTTGSITIPMMKKTGYNAEFAGAVEASASTGGQIMPPIMGAAAFLMSEYMGIPYSKVALYAILPAVLYFLGIFIAVHLEAKRLGLKGLNRDELPKINHLLPRIYLLTPLVVLVWLVSANIYTMQKSASIAIVVTIGVAIVEGLFDREKRLKPAMVLDALSAGAKGTITVAVACAIAGIIAGCITVTGLASQLISAIVTISGGKIFIGLFLTMICCIILGMGVPTTANYCIMAATCAPILIRMNVDPVAAHFFVFYFGIVADITPPVALAAYAGSAIAKGNPMKTGITATKLAIAAFIVPYIFAMNESMLLIDTSPFAEVVVICITAVCGIFGVAVALNGFMFRQLSWALRIAFLVGGLTLLIPGIVTDLIGLVIVGGLSIYLYSRRDK